MRPVERVDEPFSIRCPGPARRLNRTGNFQGQLPQVLLRGRRVQFSLAHQPPEIAVRGDVVEPVIVDTNVRQVRRHSVQSRASTTLEKPLLACRIELQQSRTILKTLRPLGPTTGRVLALN